MLYFAPKVPTTAGANKQPNVYTKYKVASAVGPSLSSAFKLLSKFCIALNGANRKKNATVNTSVDKIYLTIIKIS